MEGGSFLRLGLFRKEGKTTAEAGGAVVVRHSASSGCGDEICRLSRGRGRRQQEVQEHPQDSSRASAQVTGNSGVQ